MLEMLCARWNVLKFRTIFLPNFISNWTMPPRSKRHLKSIGHTQKEVAADGNIGRSTSKRKASKCTTIMDREEINNEENEKTINVTKQKRKRKLHEEELVKVAESQNSLKKVLDNKWSKGDRLTSEWFDRPCVDLAKSLLGMKLVHLTDSDDRISGIIVETEAYLGGEDKASNGGKQTESNKALFMKPGTACVHSTYGMYFLINISSRGDGAGVHIRGLEPCEGEEFMRKLRCIKKPEKSDGLKFHQLCNGPAKLSMALGVTKANGNQVDLATSPRLWVEKGDPVTDNNIVACKRIGIDRAGKEWANKPLRFYIQGCASVSIRDINAETGST